MACQILKSFEEHFATSIPLHPIPPRNNQSPFGCVANARFCRESSGTAPGTALMASHF